MQADLIARVILLLLVWPLPPAWAEPPAAPLGIHAIPADLTLPEVQQRAPASGIRVRATTAGWEGTEVHHILYLPSDWKPSAQFPVLVEYAGNGGFRNALGDTSNGSVEESMLGYGLSGGVGMICISMPFVEGVDAQKRNAVKWWGDVSETKRYCLATVRDVCTRFGGDPSRVILCGFSRGAIACNFIGLHDDEIASLWRGFFCHSHYDGVRENWPYPGAARAAARERLARLRGRPQWISHEGSVTATEAYLHSTGIGITGQFTFAALPYENHTAAWVLRDVPMRDKARAWLAEVLR